MCEITTRIKGNASASSQHRSQRWQTTMQSLAALLLLVVAAQALDYTKLRPMEKTMPDIKSGARLEQPKSAGSRIIGGIPASRGQFPWQAAIDMDGQSFCGGSLIGSTWVLTAAHCVYQVNTFVVTLGATSISSSQTGTEIHQTRAQIRHSAYNPQTLVNDIALIALPQTVFQSNYIQYATLVPSSLGGNTLEGQIVRISGWGKTSDNGGISASLNYVDLNVISNAQCAYYYGSSVTAGTVCTSSATGGSTCSGDSGGPLIILLSDNNYYQVGIVSFGSTNGCTLGYPAAFTRVTAYLSWISSNTGLRHL